MRLSSLFLFAGLLLSFGANLRAQPLSEIYKKQQSLRLKVEETCQAQFEEAQYIPLEGEPGDIRYMISAKGVQAITAGIVPAGAAGSYKCDRQRFEKPMLLGRTYSIPRNSHRRILSCSNLAVRALVREGVIHPNECGGMARVRFELEACVVKPPFPASWEGYRAMLENPPPGVETVCLVMYEQDSYDGLVQKRFLAARRQ